MSKIVDINQLLSKITEATTDALFNLPALVTTQNWNKIAPAYIYSFDYRGQSNARGSTFLNGLPLVGSKSSSSMQSNNLDSIGHGDELIYLFDARDIFGHPIENSAVIYWFILYSTK